MKRKSTRRKYWCVVFFLWWLFFVLKKKRWYSTNPACTNRFHITCIACGIALSIAIIGNGIFEATRHCIDDGHLAFECLDMGKIFKQISTWLGRVWTLCSYVAPQMDYIWRPRRTILDGSMGMLVVHLEPRFWYIYTSQCVQLQQKYSPLLDCFDCWLTIYVTGDKIAVRKFLK